MIPIKLTIEGLYSYQKRQTIDFKSLTDAGLFGIFGPVGSGKSSILEAISFALYGETERLNNRDRRTYNMMNLRSNRSYIAFDFLNYKNKLFRAERSFKRSTKNFEKITPVNEVVFYENKNKEWVPVKHANASEIVGLSYTNFKRTIIIPQGQFKEFLELGAKDRTEMMKDIFQLHRFDLQENVKLLNKNNQSQLDHTDGRLSGYESVSDENIKSLKKELAEQQKEAAVRQKAFDTHNEYFQQLKVVKADFENLKQKRKEFNLLEERKTTIDQEETQLATYERIYDAFHQILREEKKVLTDLERKKQETEKQQEQLYATEKKVDALKNRIEEIQPDYDALSDKRLEEYDLALLIQIQNYTNEIKKLVERTQKGKQYVEEARRQEQEIQNQIKTAEKKIESLSAGRIETAILMSVNNWFNEQRNLHQTLLRKEQELKDRAQQAATITSQLKSTEMQIDSFEADYQKQVLQLEARKKELESQKSYFKVQEKLSEYAHDLKVGEPCPLCGSPEHPSIAEIEDVTTNTKAIEQELLTLESESKIKQNKYYKFKTLIDRKALFEDQVKQINQELAILKGQIRDHRKKFIWKEFDADDIAAFEKRKEEAAELDKVIAAGNRDLSEQRKQLEKTIQDEKKFSEALETFKREETKKNSQIQQNKSLLKKLDYDNFKTVDPISLEKQLTELKRENVAIETKYKQLTEDFNRLTPQVAARTATVNSLRTQLEELQKQATSLSHEIHSTLRQQKIDSREDVYQILELNLEIPQIRTRIQDFRLRYLTLKNNLIELEAKLRGVAFDETLFKDQEQKLAQLDRQLKGGNEQVAQTKGRVNQMSEKLIEKNKLLEKKEKLEKRARNLKIISKLFKGAGFVKYASSIYLQQLCDHANIRFHRMTKNQLSLRLDENNNFGVIDYLNEGRSRSVKTLSGGQAFQASLCLALALAESVQANAKAEKNFFFIDEGFGTQDMESVNIVFDTLLNLQRENRIIGIISHVETLKEKIPIALTIEKDKEKGSRIIREW